MKLVQIIVQRSNAFGFIFSLKHPLSDWYVRRIMTLKNYQYT